MIIDLRLASMRMDSVLYDTGAIVYLGFFLPYSFKFLVVLFLTKQI
jgi:hypothetical protein